MGCGGVAVFCSGSMVNESSVFVLLLWSVSNGGEPEAMCVIESILADNAHQQANKAPHGVVFNAPHTL